MQGSIRLLLIVGIVFNSAAFAQGKNTLKRMTNDISPKDTVSITVSPRITFIELGSVNCIPCKAMQKVMKSVEDKYGSQIKIVFYDVWKADQAQEYSVRLIPTQVFLDANGKELMRHEGYFPEKDIDSFLQSKGLNSKYPAKE